jgi:hypothetical protein
MYVCFHINYLCMYVRMHALCMYTCTCACMYASMYVCIRVCMCVCMYASEPAPIPITFPHHSASLSVCLSPRTLPPDRSDSSKNKPRSVLTASARITSYRKLVGLVLFICNSATTQGHGELGKRTARQHKCTYGSAQGHYFICQRSFVTCGHYFAVRMRGRCSCLS